MRWNLRVQVLAALVVMVAAGCSGKTSEQSKGSAETSTGDAAESKSPDTEASSPAAGAAKSSDETSDSHKRAAAAGSTQPGEAKPGETCGCVPSGHSYRQKQARVYWVPSRNGWVYGLQGEFLKLCSHASGNVQPDQVNWTSGFGHDTTAVVHFKPLSAKIPGPFVEADSVFRISWNSHQMLTLRKDLGKKRLEGWVTVECKNCVAKKAHIQQGPVVDADD